MIKVGDFIKHEKFLDVCIEIERFSVHPDGIYIVGAYWNQAYVDSFSIGQIAFLDIATKESGISDMRPTHLGQWVHLDRDEVNKIFAKNDGIKLREASWKKLEI